MGAFYIREFVSFRCKYVSMTYPGAVDELSQGDISVVAKDVDIAEGPSSAVLEFDTEEIAGIRGRAATELNRDGRSIVSYKGVSSNKPS